jgi:tetraacyldisaccharide 4'-kinase
MNNPPFFLIIPLRILSFFYGVVVSIRNWLFETNVLRSKEYTFPIISVGNITVGGTGKTPHTEYILSLLSQTMKVATLSRGYKRRTSGFVLADNTATGATVGDEAYQIKRKFPQVAVAVDANRRQGIDKLLKNKEIQPLSAIVLDDAFQHRYVTPGLNILITDSNRLFTEDHLLPYGRLRESATSKHRANIIIVSKCPASFQPMDFRIISQKIAVFPFQSLYFTTYEYGEIYPLFAELASVPPFTKELLRQKNGTVLAVTGIVSPEGLYEHVKSYTPNCVPMAFPDHYNFKYKDYQAIAQSFEAIKETKIILVTEKDAARLFNDPLLPEALKPYLYALPIKIKFLLDQESKFNQQILNYVSENTRNNSFPKQKH